MVAVGSCTSPFYLNDPIGLDGMFKDCLLRYVLYCNNGYLLPGKSAQDAKMIGQWTIHYGVCTVKGELAGLSEPLLY
jgi:hypothetical protein